MSKFFFFENFHVKSIFWVAHDTEKRHSPFLSRSVPPALFLYVSYFGEWIKNVD